MIAVRDHSKKKGKKKENKIEWSAGITGSKGKEKIRGRGQKIGNIENFPIIVSDEIETVEHTKDIVKILNSLNLMDDVNRLKSRKPRTGKSALRGRGKKIGKSILFVVSKSEKLAKACGTIPGIDVKMVKELSVLDLAPGASPIRLTVYSKSALDDIAKIKSSHLELMVTIKWKLNKQIK